MGITLSSGARNRVRSAFTKAARARIERDGLDEAAAAFGVTSSCARMWRSGHSRPSYMMCVRLAGVLGLDPVTGREVKS